MPENETKVRLDRFLANKLPEYSRSRLQQLIRSGFVRLNGAPTRPRHLVRSGDKIELTEPALEKIDYQREPIPLEVLFEDKDIIVINKPAGLVVHPGAGHRQHTLVNALLSHCTTLSGIGGKERPGIVHRLDKETSGCLVVAKNDETHRDLSKQFAERTVEKIYLALVAGKLRKEAGVIEEKIGRHPVHRQRMSAGSPRGRAGCIADGRISFGCIFIISGTLCAATRFTRPAWQKISRGKCCTPGNLDFDIRAVRNGKASKRSYPTISQPR